MSSGNNKRHRGKKIKENNQARDSRTTKLLSILSRPGTLQILSDAENGVKLQREAIENSRQARKECDARIFQLAEAGLIKKVGNKYLQTTFGKKVCENYIPRLEAVFMSRV